MATTSEHSFKFIDVSIYLAIMCGILVAIFILIPIPIFYKIGFLAFGLIVVMFLINSYFGLMVFLCVRPSIQPLLDDFYIIEGVPTVGVFTLLIIIFLLFKFFTDKTYTIKIPNIEFLLLLIPFSLFSIFNSINITDSLAHLMRLVGWLSIYIFIFNLVKNKEDAKKIIIVLICSAFYPIIIGYYQLFTHSGYTDLLRGLNRITSTFGGQANAAAIFFSMIFFITMTFFAQSKNLLTRRLLLLVIAFILILIVFTYHRSSQLGLLAGLLIISIFNRKMLKVMVPLFLLVALVFHDEIGKRIIELYEPPSKYAGSSLSTRFELWSISLKLILQHPILGCGIGMADNLIGKHFVFMPPHNDYLRLAVEIGIIGSLLFVIFLMLEIRYYLIKLITNTNKELNVFALGLLIYFIVVSISQNNFYNVTNMGVLFSMLAVSKKLNLIQQKNRVSIT